MLLLCWPQPFPLERAQRRRQIHRCPRPVIPTIFLVYISIRSIVSWGGELGPGGGVSLTTQTTFLGGVHAGIPEPAERDDVEGAVAEGV